MVGYERQSKKDIHTKRVEKTDRNTKWKIERVRKERSKKRESGKEKEMYNVS